MSEETKNCCGNLKFSQIQDNSDIQRLSVWLFLVTIKCSIIIGGLHRWPFLLIKKNIF